VITEAFDKELQARLQDPGGVVAAVKFHNDPQFLYHLWDAS